MNTLLLSTLALLTALLHLWAAYRGPQWLVYLAKPMTTTLILLMAFTAAAPMGPLYQWAVVIGLLFALAGDIFLMLPTDRFVAGLVSFLITHLCYIIAFGTQSQPPFWSPGSVGVLLYALIIYALLHRHLGRMRLPVLLYLVAIAAMAWLGLALATEQQSLWAIAAGAGSVLFVISDSVLALNRFRQPFAAAQLLVLSTYYLAQWLIAWSVHGLT